MLFDIAWPELLLIGAVALVVIGPKDLPRALRVAGMWVRKARTLSREFQNSVDQMIREAELEEMREELKKATDFNIEAEVRKTVDPTGELAESIRPPDMPDYFAEHPASADTALPGPAEPALIEPTVEAAFDPEPGETAPAEPAAAAVPAASEPAPPKP